ncbi:MAG: sugar phosphate nucleotidyltransferase [archaeon]
MESSREAVYDMRRRISITLKEDVLQRLDELSGETSESNRSRAIEKILEDALSPTGVPAVILAGDAQSLKETSGKPIILQIIAFLREMGVSKITICTTSSISSELKKVIGNAEGTGINYSEQKEKTGTAAALKKIKSKPKGVFLLIYGDNFFEFNLNDLVGFHNNSGADVTAALTTVKTPTDFGVVDLQGKFITAFNEKPKEAESHLVSTGIFVFSESIFPQISESARSLEKDVFPGLCAKRKLAGCVLSGKWLPAERQSS